MKTSVWMMKFRALFHVRDLAVYNGSHFFQLLIALAAGSLGFSRFGKLVSPNQAHGRLWCFFSILKFLKITNEARSRIWKQMSWQILDPRVNNFPQNCLECDPALIYWLKFEFFFWDCNSVSRNDYADRKIARKHSSERGTTRTFRNVSSLENFQESLNRKKETWYTYHQW